MGSDVSIGIVWPGPPGPGGVEEARRFAPSGVELRVAGALPEPGIPGDITLERATKHAEIPHIEAAARQIALEGAQSIA